MNILSITGILPIPGITKSNDFLIPLYSAYKDSFPGTNVFLFRLEKFVPFSPKNTKYRSLKSYELSGFPVKLLRFFSIWRHQNIHTIVSSYTAWLFNRRFIGNFIRQNNISVIHAEYIFPDGGLAYLISKKFHIPYLVTTHYEFRYFQTAFSRSIALKVLRNAAFVTPLNYPAMKLFKDYSVKNIMIVPHGIEEVFLKASPKPHHEGIIRILSIGVLIPLKNFDKVIRALSKLKERFNFHYTLVGSGPEDKNLARLAEEMNIKDRVTFIKKVPYEAIAEEISKHDILVMPSYFESFGRALTEAMAVGLPVICAKNTGIHGYFKEGEEGFSVDHHNLQELEEKLSILMESDQLRRKMGAKAKLLLHQFTWDKIAFTFHNLYLKSTEKNKAK